MEHQTILNSLHDANDSKFLTRPWNMTIQKEIKLSIIKKFQNITFVITTMFTFK